MTTEALTEREQRSVEALERALVVAVRRRLPMTLQLVSLELHVAHSSLLVELVEQVGAEQADAQGIECA